MLHELTHGLSRRLHSDSAGLNTNMSNGLGEGWSDFVAQSLLADASDDVNGVYTIGGWSTEELAAGFENYYYGIRRFPYAVKTAVGANGRPHNPMTFADIDTTKADLTDGAFPPSTVLGSAVRDAVHEAGQIWAAMLWEVRARFITRLGFAEGNRRILQLVIDGMKGDPVNPTFLTARDSILAAAIAGGTPADVADIWSGFAARGLGVLAAITVNGSNGSTRVNESFQAPGDPLPTFTINDVSTLEGNAGTTALAFTVSLANPSSGTSTVAFATANGTAISARRNSGRHVSSGGDDSGVAGGSHAVPGDAQPRRRHRHDHEVGRPPQRPEAHVSWRSRHAARRSGRAAGHVHVGRRQQSRLVRKQPHHHVRGWRTGPDRVPDRERDVCAHAIWSRVMS